MRRRPIPCRIVGPLVWIAFMSVLPPGPARAADDLTPLTVLGYGCWVQDLAVAAADSLPSRLYPLGLSPQDALAQGSPERLSALTRELRAREHALTDAWDAASFKTEASALAAARAYRDVGQYELALRWYAIAQEAAGLPLPTGPLAHEMFATAVLSGDSLRIDERCRDLLAAGDLSANEGAAVVAYRHYLARNDRPGLRRLLAQASAQPERLTPALLFWQSYCLVAEGRRAETVPLLLRLVSGAQSAAGLEGWQRIWVVRALPDGLYMADRGGAAAILYGMLAVHPTGEAPLWASYQLANFALRDGDYAGAAALYRRSAGTAPVAAWQLRAVALAGTAEQLVGVGKGVARHDDAHDSRP
jgi:hypothetical protein